MDCRTAYCTFINKVIIIIGRGGQARSFNYLGPIGLGNGPEVLGNGNGPHLLCIMSHSGLCRSALCRIRQLCRIRHYVAFCLMSFGIVLFSVMSLG